MISGIPSNGNPRPLVPPGTDPLRLPPAERPAPGVAAPVDSTAPPSPSPEGRPTEGGRLLIGKAVLPFREPDAWKKTWQPQVIYFPLTDRFQDGDPTNNSGADWNNPLAFHGGDLRGIIDRLDYIQGLGATTLWIPPVADNTNHVKLGDYEGTGYHGYWIRDHYAVEEHQGTMDTLKELVQKAHDRGMKVILDIVLNHVGFDHPWTTDPSKKDWFHNHGTIRDWNNPYELENGEVGGLKDLDQENPAVYDELLKNTLWWIEHSGVDGIRLDAVKHIPKACWERFAADIKARKGSEFLLLGEVLHGDPAVQAPYQRAGLDALFDIPMYYTLREVFGEGQSAEKLGERLDEDWKYADPGKLVTLLDNHDFARFMHSAGGSRERLKLALAFLMTLRGIPSIYYGTEVGMPGGHDPDNRRDMEFGRDPDMVAHVQKLTSIRQANPALQFGEQLEMWRDPGLYAFARRFEGQEVVAVFNNSHDHRAQEIPLRHGSPLSPGTVLQDALTGETFQVGNGKLRVHLPGKSARILVRR